MNAHRDSQLDSRSAENLCKAGERVDDDGRYYDDPSGPRPPHHASTITSEQVAGEISSEAQARFGVTPASVNCPSTTLRDGGSVRCKVTLEGGQSREFIATVAGDHASFTITLDLAPEGNAGAAHPDELAPPASNTAPAGSPDPSGAGQAKTTACKRVKTGERLVYAIRAANVSCSLARQVARAGWSVSPPGWRCSGGERTLCGNHDAIVTFESIPVGPHPAAKAEDSTGAQAGDPRRCPAFATGAGSGLYADEVTVAGTTCAAAKTLIERWDHSGASPIDGWRCSAGTTASPRSSCTRGSARIELQLTDRE